MFDLTGCGAHNLDVAVMRNVIGIMAAHYAGRMSAMYFYNAPPLFHTLFAAGKALMPEVRPGRCCACCAVSCAVLRAVCRKRSPVCRVAPRLGGRYAAL